MAAALWPPIPISADSQRFLVSTSRRNWRKETKSVPASQQGDQFSRHSRLDIVAMQSKQFGAVSVHFPHLIPITS